MKRLTFKFLQREDLEDKICTFRIENLSVSDDAIDYDDIKLDIGDDPYRGEFQSFSSNSVSTESVFEGVLNAFLRDDTQSFEYIEGWEVFSKLKEKQINQDGLLLKFPQIEFGSIEMYKLDLAIGEWKYYTCCEKVMLLAEGNDISTDSEFFFTNALIEDLEKIDKGESYIYMSDELNKYMPEMLEKEEE